MKNYVIDRPSPSYSSATSNSRGVVTIAVACNDSTGVLREKTPPTVADLQCPHNLLTDKGGGSPPLKKSDLSLMQ